MSDEEEFMERRKKELTWTGLSNETIESIIEMDEVMKDCPPMPKELLDAIIKKSIEKTIARRKAEYNKMNFWQRQRYSWRRFYGELSSMPSSIISMFKRAYRKLMKK